MRINALNPGDIFGDLLRDPFVYFRDRSGERLKAEPYIGQIPVRIQPEPGRLQRTRRLLLV